MAYNDSPRERTRIQDGGGDEGPPAQSGVTRRRFLAWSSVVAAGGLLAACGGTTTSGPGRQAAGGRIVMDQMLEPRVMNSITLNYQYLRWLSEPVEETLYRYDDQGEIKPLLTTSMPEVSDDKLTWTVELREGIAFHNDDPLTADRVVPVFEAAKEEGQWVSHFAWLDHAEVVGERTVRFHLSQPFGIFIEKLVALPIGHPDFVKDNETLVGTGPYVFDTYNQGSDLLLTRNKDYWGESPAVDEIEFRFVSDAGAALVSVMNGDSTIYAEPRPSDGETIESQDGVQLRAVEAPYQLLWWTNVSKPPFDDVRVRQAMAYAMNRQRVVDVVYAGYATPGQGTIGPAMQGYDPDYELYPLGGDPDRAKDLLAEAGYGDGGTIDFEVVTATGPVTESLGSVLQQDWAAVNLSANISYVELGVWAERWFAGDFNIIVLPDMSGFSAGHTPFNMLITNTSEDPANFHGYSNPKFDDLVMRSLASSDEDERAELWQQADRILAEDAVSTPPAHPDLLIAHSDSLTGMTDGALSLGRLNFAQYTLSS